MDFFLKIDLIKSCQNNPNRSEIIVRNRNKFNVFYITLLYQVEAKLAEVKARVAKQEADGGDDLETLR